MQLNGQRLSQEAETFKQHKLQEQQWFKLRLIMGYSSIVLLAIVMAVSVHILLNHKEFSNLVLTSAGAALFVDVLGLLIAIWRIVFNADFKSKLTPVTIGNQFTPFLVHSAMYGKDDQFVDVTHAIRPRILPQYLEFKVTNENIGCDPVEGEIKTLKVVYSYAGETNTKTVQENQMMTLP